MNQRELLIAKIESNLNRVNTHSGGDLREEFKIIYGLMLELANLDTGSEDK